MIKILIGGSPCTYWSVAQKKNREIEAEGQGWELFKNYLIAKEKFKPDFFLYENNKSAAQPIKDQISQELGYPLDYINSALVSAQHRERFYVHNWTNPQPEDRGILLKDILESGVVDKEKSYCLKHQAGNARDYFKKHHTQIAFEPIRIPEYNKDKSRPVTSSYCKKGTADGSLEWDCFSENPNKQKFDFIAEPIKIGDVDTNAQAHRVYSIYGKSRTLIANAGEQGGKTGLYMIPINESDKSKSIKIHEVINGEIEINGKNYPIKLPDGYYIIRKLTPIECERLQTLPDDYTAGISDTQRYKCLGNGWTAEVIIHMLSYGLKDVPRDEEVIVLSMYDGIATGRYCLDKLGFTNVKYYAYEIDKYAIQVAKKNYPDIIEMGDAFDVRKDDWKLPTE